MQARERLREARVGPLASFLPTAVFLVGCGTVLAKNSWYYFEESPTAICQKICNGMSFAAAPKLARYISDHSSPASRVAILGFEPEIYFYAHRHAALAKPLNWTRIMPIPTAIEARWNRNWIGTKRL
jgi:hypothetical protein